MVLATSQPEHMMRPKAASNHPSESDEVHESVTESCSGTCTPAVAGIPPPLASPVLPPRILTVDASWLTLSWNPPVWDVSGDNTTVYGLRYRVLIATVHSNADARVQDIHSYHCVYEGIETSTQV